MSPAAATCAPPSTARCAIVTASSERARRFYLLRRVDTPPCERQSIDRQAQRASDSSAARRLRVCHLGQCYWTNYSATCLGAVLLDQLQCYATGPTTVLFALGQCYWTNYSMICRGAVLLDDTIGGTPIGRRHSGWGIKTKPCMAAVQARG